MAGCGPSPRSQARCQKTSHQPDGHRTRYVYLWPNPAVRPLPSRRRRKISDPRTVWDISESRNRPEAVFIDYFGVEENGAMARPNFSVNDRGHLFAMFVEREVAPYTSVLVSTTAHYWETHARIRNVFTHVRTDRLGR
jgi:hypothetical protein